MLHNSSEINAMNPTFARKLGLNTRKTNVGVQKIDGSTLETFEMVIADSQVDDKGSRPKFFQETFLVTDTKFEVMLGMLFLKHSNANISFGERTLTWKSYTINKALPTIKQVQLVDPKEFVIAALDTNSETFVIHVTIREREKMVMDPYIKPRIEAQSGAQSRA